MPKYFAYLFGKVREMRGEKLQDSYKYIHNVYIRKKISTCKLSDLYIKYLFVTSMQNLL